MYRCVCIVLQHSSTLILYLRCIYTFVCVRACPTFQNPLDVPLFRTHVMAYFLRTLWKLHFVEPFGYPNFSLFRTLGIPHLLKPSGYPTFRTLGMSHFRTLDAPLFRTLWMLHFMEPLGCLTLPNHLDAPLLWDTLLFRTPEVPQFVEPLHCPTL